MSSISFGPKRPVPFSGAEKNIFKIMAILIGIVIAVFLLSSCSSCTSMQRRDATIASILKEKDEAIEYLENRNKYSEDLIKAYNHLIHRVWIDKPNYFEDALSETDEFSEINELLSGNWEDTFSFYDEEDSLAYHINWDNGDSTIRIAKHIVEIPEQTLSRLKSVFDDYDE